MQQHWQTHLTLTTRRWQLFVGEAVEVDPIVEGEALSEVVAATEGIAVETVETVAAEEAVEEVVLWAPSTLKP